MSDVKFLTTNDILAGIERIINESSAFLYIISPYNQIEGNIKRRLEDEASLEGVEVHLVYRKGDNGKESHRQKESRVKTEKWLSTVPWVKAHILGGLHAKCYLNEKEALVTSINLYDWSTRNVEIGVLVSLKGWFPDYKDEKPYKNILKHAQEIIDWSEDAPILAKVTATAQKHKPSTIATKEKAKEARRVVAIIEHGSCIRCGDEINADPSKPFCNRHWRYWNKEKYNEYNQRYCHLCGKGDGVTRLRPACYTCWDKNKDRYEWPAA